MHTNPNEYIYIYMYLYATTDRNKPNIRIGTEKISSIHIRQQRQEL